MKKIVLACGLLGILGVLGINCGGNACDSYADTVTAKYSECGVEIATGSSDAETACSDANAKLADCLSPCVANLKCECIDPDKIAAGECTAEISKEYTDCFTACN